MSTTSLLPLIFSNLVIVETVMTDTKLLISTQARATPAQCPKCGVVSSQYHSSYFRYVQDTPIGLCLVWLQITVRRFRCANPNCQQQTFSEQHPDLVSRRCRRTKRLLSNLVQIGLALGGAAGARLAVKLAMAVWR
ncbi:MAG: transposase family protein [Anaerolineales bacterium]|nr:transposase family protein [Anaerolineales bacterium]